MELHEAFKLQRAFEGGRFTLTACRFTGEGRGELRGPLISGLRGDGTVCKVLAFPEATCVLNAELV